MHDISSVPKQNFFRSSVISAAVASALLSAYAATGCAAGVPVIVHGVVAGSYFTPPTISDSPTASAPSSTVASVYQSVKVCFDANDNGVCDPGETSTFTKSDGSFLLSTVNPGPLVAEIPTTATNAGHPVVQRNVFRVHRDHIAAVTPAPLVPANVAVTPLSTELSRMIENESMDFFTARQHLADRLGVTTDQVISDPNKVASPAKTALLTESVILTNRFGMAAKIVDRGDVASIKDAHDAVMNIEGIPRYDHIFIVMLENKATLSIRNSAFAPNINKYLNAGNQFTNYFATGNPSEPNYTALGGADDFGITDDNQWNNDATATGNPVQDLPLPTSNQPGLGSSPFSANPGATGVNHNITGRPNLFNALSKGGMTWRTYNESMNPGQDIRTDSVADTAVTTLDHIYAPHTVGGDGTTGGNAAAIGTTNLILPMPAGLYKTKHHPGMAYQNVRSAPEFISSNRTLGGGQWDFALVNSSTYPTRVPSGYNIDQFSADLQSGDIGNLNFVIPDQCDDMHGITVQGKVGGAGNNVTASDCASVANNVSPTAVSPIITRGDNYVDFLVRKIEASPIWQNTAKRVAIVLMFDEGNATSGFNSCCGWNTAAGSGAANAKPLTQNPDGSFSIDTSVPNYFKGNRGHGNSIFGVLTNQPGAPKGVVDNDAYSHFSFVRTLQDMFQLADPKVDGSYMNRSKYTESFIAANILNLPEFTSSADTHFDAVRPMNHGFVAPGGFVQKQSADRNTPAQVGPDASQTNVWSLR